MVCQPLKITGSRMPKKMCKTESEWTKLSSRFRDAYQEIRDRPVTGCSSPSGGAC
jgi:hypothetical protein